MNATLIDNRTRPFTPTLAPDKVYVLRQHWLADDAWTAMRVEYSPDRDGFLTVVEHDDELCDTTTLEGAQHVARQHAERALTWELVDGDWRSREEAS